jgi:hypothetical protein
VRWRDSDAAARPVGGGPGAGAGVEAGRADRSNGRRLRGSGWRSGGEIRRGRKEQSRRIRPSASPGWRIAGVPCWNRCFWSRCKRPALRPGRARVRAVRAGCAARDGRPSRGVEAEEARYLVERAVSGPTAIYSLGIATKQRPLRICHRVGNVQGKEVLLARNTKPHLGTALWENYESDNCFGRSAI